MSGFKAIEVKELLKDSIIENKEMLQDTYRFYSIAKRTIKDNIVVDKIDSINSYINKAINKLVELQYILNK